MRKHYKPIEMRWPIWAFLAFLLLPAFVWTYNGINEAYWNAQFIKLGKAVDCRTRPNPRALICDPRTDGIDCIEGSRGWLRDWHQPIDEACSRFEPERVFRFEVAEKD